MENSPFQLGVPLEIPRIKISLNTNEQWRYMAELIMTANDENSSFLQEKPKTRVEPAPNIEVKRRITLEG